MIVSLPRWSGSAVGGVVALMTLISGAWLWLSFCAASSIGGAVEIFIRDESCDDECAVPWFLAQMDGRMNSDGTAQGP